MVKPLWMMGGRFRGRRVDYSMHDVFRGAYGLSAVASASDACADRKAYESRGENHGGFVLGRSAAEGRRSEAQENNASGRERDCEVTCVGNGHGLCPRRGWAEDERID